MECFRGRCSGDETGRTVEFCHFHRVVKEHDDMRDLLERCKDHCLCDRSTRGFDYGEHHLQLGKPKPGARWLTPTDMIRAFLNAQQATESEKK